MIRLLQVDGDASHFQFSLPSLLQLIGMERKTCTLTVEQDGRVGRLYVRDGDLLDAECGALRGEDAAVTIAGWASPSIVVSTHCPVTEKVIASSLGYVILEAMRREDESASNGVPASVRSLTWDAAGPSSEKAAQSDVRPSRRHPGDVNGRVNGSVWPPAMPIPSLDTFEGALGVSVVSAAGRVLCSAPPNGSEFSGWAVLASKLLGFQRTTLRNTAPGQHVEEIVLSTGELCHVVRPLPRGAGTSDGDGGWFVLLTFDPRTSSLVRRKLELDRFAGEVLAASGSVNHG